MEIEYLKPFELHEGYTQAFVERWELVFYSKDRLDVFLGHIMACSKQLTDSFTLFVVSSKGGEQILISRVAKNTYCVKKL